MPHIDDFVKDIMENGVSAKTPHEAEIKELTGVITAEKEKIEGEYEKSADSTTRTIPTRPTVSSARL